MRSGMKTEASIKDLNALAVCSCQCGGKSMDDTVQTADLSSNNSESFISDGSAKSQQSPSGRVRCNKCMDESSNTSFSDLVKERSQSLGSSFGVDFDETSFAASNSSLDWAEDQAFPKSKRASDTPSTTCSTVDLSSDFLVLSAFQLINQEKENSDNDTQSCDEEEDDEDVESGDEEDDDYDEEEEEFPVVDFDAETKAQATVLGLTADEIERFLAPSPRDSIKGRRSSAQQQKHQLQHQQHQLQQQQDREDQASLCQHLARTCIDLGKSPRRGRGRLRDNSLIKHQPSPLLRLDSERSAATENDAAEALKQCRLRSISRNGKRTESRPPTTRGQGRTARDRSVSRDRSTATAPTTLQTNLLGKTGDSDDDEIEDDLLACPWVVKAPTNKAKVHQGLPKATSKQSTPTGTPPTPAPSAKSSKREQRHRRGVSETRNNSNKVKSRRRCSTKSEDQQTGTKKRVATKKRTSLKDASARSNPEQQQQQHQRSLEDRLNSLTASARSNPERTCRPALERKPSCDMKPIKPRRTRSKAKEKGTLPSLSSMLNA